MGTWAMASSETHVITVFRNRIRPGADAAYAETAPRIADLAASMPGFVDAKTFSAPDGERVTVVTFASQREHDAWRDHPEHRAVQRRGVDDFYSWYSIQVGTVTYSNEFITGS